MIFSRKSALPIAGELQTLICNVSPKCPQVPSTKYPSGHHMCAPGSVWRQSARLKHSLGTQPSPSPQRGECHVCFTQSKSEPCCVFRSEHPGMCVSFPLTDLGLSPQGLRFWRMEFLFVFICGVCIVGFSYIAQDGNLPASASKVLVSQGTTCPGGQQGAKSEHKKSFSYYS